MEDVVIYIAVVIAVILLAYMFYYLDESPCVKINNTVNNTMNKCCCECREQENSNG